ncbi:NAD(P)-dependent oxidoreductase [Herbiconiux sp. 11R-BC]|uniref:NAD(P)-dependent oxidoreductase n=1 Tax=Herbiconiux sp. 11R-BC TaxID=3111637 RepID=UPI003C04487C
MQRSDTSDPARGEPARVGVIGLGRMGLPIARRLRATERVVVAGFDTDPLRRADFSPSTPEHASDAVALARWADLLVTVLPGPLELDALLRAGVLGALRAGAVWVDLTSGDPRVARGLAREAEARGVGAVGAPMAGGPSDAEAGTLGFFVGGPPDAVERALPVLHVLGDPERIERAGDDVGAGHVAKLLANTLWFGQVAAVTEALLIGHAQGIDSERLAAVLRRSAGGSAFLDRHLDRLLEGDYLETFGLDRVVEELDTVTALAAEAGLTVALTGLVAELHHEALERFGAVDGELLVAKLLEERAGARIRRPVHDV